HLRADCGRFPRCLFVPRQPPIFPRVGGTGFEPAASCAQGKRSSQAELTPVVFTPFSIAEPFAETTTTAGGFTPNGAAPQGRARSRRWTRTTARSAPCPCS